MERPPWLSTERLYIAGLSLPSEEAKCKQTHLAQWGSNRAATRVCSLELCEVWVTLTFFKAKDRNKLILWNPWELPLQITAREKAVSVWQKAKFTPNLYDSTESSSFESCMSMCICVHTASSVHKMAFATVRSLCKTSCLHWVVHRVEKLPCPTFQLRARVKSPVQHAKLDSA